MADVALRTETTGVRPQFEYVETSRRRAVQDGPEMGVRFAREVNEAPLRRYRLVWNLANEGQKYLLRKAWTDSLGGVLAMDYTPVGDVDANALEVRFLDGTLRLNRSGLDSWQMEVEVEEVL